MGGCDNLPPLVELNVRRRQLSSSLSLTCKWLIFIDGTSRNALDFLWPGDDKGVEKKRGVLE